MNNWNEFLYWENSTRDTIDVKKIYIDIAEDLTAGILLSQIIFWFLPNKSGETKLRIKRMGKLWLAKKRSDWWNEIRITEKQFDRAVAILEKKDLIETHLYLFGGHPVKHITLNKEKILKEINRLENAYSPKGQMNEPQEVKETIFPKGQNGYSPKGKWIFPKGQNV